MAELAESFRADKVELGTETNQGAVGFVIDRTFYEIEVPLGGE